MSQPSPPLVKRSTPYQALLGSPKSTKNCQFHNTLTVRDMLRVFMGSIPGKARLFWVWHEHSCQLKTRGTSGRDGSVCHPTNHLPPHNTEKNGTARRPSLPRKDMVRVFMGCTRMSSQLRSFRFKKSAVQTETVRLRRSALVSSPSLSRYWLKHNTRLDLSYHLLLSALSVP